MDVVCPRCTARVSSTGSGFSPAIVTCASCGARFASAQLIARDPTLRHRQPASIVVERDGALTARAGYRVHAQPRRGTLRVLGRREWLPFVLVSPIVLLLNALTFRALLASRFETWSELLPHALVGRAAGGDGGGARASSADHDRRRLAHRVRVAVCVALGPAGRCRRPPRDLRAGAARRGRALAPRRRRWVELRLIGNVPPDQARYLAQLLSGSDSERATDRETHEPG
ncbi:hypothetical protein DB32_002343 [Sandaracinus amylolyticus]|uniref:Uncharacterized protein n=1 Tax=Sandaracinus amylolyticus TaxID=927083 RepID=A0A0F6SEH3_9BACT|nr:hypothetical protein DB32_002343 [Sandaracinus amylolyticus]